MYAKEKYLSRLQKNRSVWVNGRKVESLTSEPCFKGAIETTLKYYEMLELDGFNFSYEGQKSAISLMIPTSSVDLAFKRNAYKAVADLSFGMLGRTPDFMNAALCAMKSHAEFFGKNEYTDFSRNVSAFYDRCAREHLFVGHGAINPQIDRSRPLSAQENTYAGIACKTFDDSGIRVSGAKMIVTLAPIADQLLIFNMPGLTNDDQDYALAFTVPTDAVGLKIICRKPLTHDSYSEFDYPISSKIDEIDAYLVLDEVFVPWNDVFIFKDVEKSNKFYDVTKTRHHTGHQGVIRGLAKAELLIGTADAIAKNLGLSGFVNIQEKLGELTTAYELIRAAVLVTETESEIDSTGTCNPRINSIQAIRYHFPKWYQLMLTTIQSLAAGSMLAVPHSKDFVNENEACLTLALKNPFLSARDRSHLLNLAWDITGDGFGQRQMVYENYHAGDPMRIAAGHYVNYDKTHMASAVDKALHIKAS